jgi:hypothetical protein
MTTTHQLVRTDAPSGRVRALTSHVAGRGLFLVMQGGREVLRGTFGECCDYVNALRQGLTTC